MPYKQKEMNFLHFYFIFRVVVNHFEKSDGSERRDNAQCKVLESSTLGFCNVRLKGLLGSLFNSRLEEYIQLNVFLHDTRLLINTVGGGERLQDMV